MSAGKGATKTAIHREISQSGQEPARPREESVTRRIWRLAQAIAFGFGALLLLISAGGFCLTLYFGWSTDLLYKVACGGSDDRLLRLAILQEPHEQNSLGQGAFHVAVAFDRLSVLPLFPLESSVSIDINLQDHTGMTPLHVAALWNREACAVWLLDHRARIDIRDHFGDTPLHTAAIFGAQGVYALLLEHGADAAAKNNDGRTPRDLAVHFGQGEMVAFIDGLKRTAGVSPASSGTRLKNAGGTPAVRIAAR